MLISATGIVYTQLQYIRHRDLGYNREEVLTVHATQFMGDGARIFQQQVEQLPGVVLLGDWRIDTGYVTTLGMTIVAGRNFSPDLATDSSGCLVN